MEEVENILNQYVKAYEKGNQDFINAFLDPLYVYYPPGGEKPLNLEQRIRDETFFFSAFTEIRTEINDKVVQGNKIACRITMRCKQTGDYQGIPSTNKQITIVYMEILLIKNGKIIEEWAEFDMQSILNQLK